MNKFKALLRDERGQTFGEYALIFALVAVVLIAVVVRMTGGIRGTFNTITDALEDPFTAGP